MNRQSHFASGFQRRFLLCWGLAACGLLLIQSNLAYAIGGPIGSAQISYRSEISPEQQTKVRTLLKHMQSELKFLEGSFINEFSHQRFGGNAEQVLKFLELLDDVALWNIELGFRDFGETETALGMSQNSSQGQIIITINSGRDDFSLKDFRRFLPAPDPLRILDLDFPKGP